MARRDLLQLESSAIPARSVTVTGVRAQGKLGSAYPGQVICSRTQRTTHLLQNFITVGLPYFCEQILQSGFIIQEPKFDEFADDRVAVTCVEVERGAPRDSPARYSCGLDRRDIHREGRASRVPVRDPFYARVQYAGPVRVAISIDHIHARVKLGLQCRYLRSARTCPDHDFPPHGTQGWIACGEDQEASGAQLPPERIASLNL